MDVLGKIIQKVYICVRKIISNLNDIHILGYYCTIVVIQYGG